MGELSWLLTVYELSFLLFGVKEAAQVEDDGQKEHEAGHGDDRHRLLAGDGAHETLAPESAGHIHLPTKVANIRQAEAAEVLHTQSRGGQDWFLFLFYFEIPSFISNYGSHEINIVKKKSVLFAPVFANPTYRILDVDTHGLVLLLLAVDLVQQSVRVLAVPAQLRAIPLRGDSEERK